MPGPTMDCMAFQSGSNRSKSHCMIHMDAARVSIKAPNKHTQRYTSWMNSETYRVNVQMKRCLSIIPNGTMFVSRLNRALK